MKSLGAFSVVLLFLFFIQNYAVGSDPGEFKLVKQNKVISLYERWIKGAGGEEVREIKAVFLVRSTVMDIARLLTDPKRGTRWNVNAKAYDIHAKGKENSWITYIRYSLPWPFDDQDCCLSHTLKYNSANNQSAEVNFESTVHEKFPVQKNITRINGAKGKWLMQSKGNGVIRITYLISTNRNTKLPRSISDPIIRNNLFETMTAFKTVLEN